MEVEVREGDDAVVVCVKDEDGPGDEGVDVGDDVDAEDVDVDVEDEDVDVGHWQSVTMVALLDRLKESGVEDEPVTNVLPTT